VNPRNELQRQVKLGCPAPYVGPVFGWQVTLIFGLEEELEVMKASKFSDVRAKLETWRRDYNEVRPYSAIGCNVLIAFQNLDGATNPPS